MTARSTPERLVHASAPADERVLAVLSIVSLVLVGVFAVSYGGSGLAVYDAVVPATYAAGFVAMLVSGAILHNQFRATGFAPFSFLANAFGISALLLVPYVIVYPRVFSPTGFGVGNDTTMWLWVAWHVAFVVLVGGYALGETYFSKRLLPIERSRLIASRYSSVALSVAIVATIGILYEHARLPALGTPGNSTPFFHLFVARTLVGTEAFVALMLVLATRLRHTTSLWIGVVLVALAVETLVAGEGPHGSFTAAWYLTLAIGVVWQALYLFVQLRHANEQLVAFAADKKSLIEVTLRDPLTQLLNRRGFDERFGDLVAESRRSGSPLSVVLFDIDLFKPFNDAYGHPAGDQALKAIAAAAALVAKRPNDACCRVGGEEFAIVLGDTDAAGAMTIAERIRENVMRLRIPHAPEMEAIKILTVSLGFATTTRIETIEPLDLYERADKALYRAKRMGRNRIVAYEAARESGLRAV